MIARPVPMITASMKATSVCVRMKPPRVSHARPMTSAGVLAAAATAERLHPREELVAVLDEEERQHQHEHEVDDGGRGGADRGEQARADRGGAVLELLLHGLDRPGDLALGQAERTTGEPVAHLLRGPGPRCPRAREPDRRPAG